MSAEELKKQLQEIKNILQPEELEKKLSNLEKESSNPTLWNNPERAKEVMKEISRIQKTLEDLLQIEIWLQEEEFEKAKELIKKYETTILFTDPYDNKDVIFSIHAGAGGTEAMDWASILHRMYTRFFDKKGWRWEEIDKVPGEEIGLKSVSLKVKGAWVYGNLKSEAGVHRLVRISPFDADKQRHTSFALVEVLPILEEKEIEIKDEDLEWQFFRSSGHGGQNINKVSTAVRVIHKPTGIIVTCQTERYQHRNRQIALEILRSKLWQLEKEKQEKKLQSFKKEKIAAWGRQIRSYVLHPYKLVKDLRTGWEDTNPEKVLDGDLDEFIIAYLKYIQQNEKNK